MRRGALMEERRSRAGRVIAAAACLALAAAGLPARGGVFLSANVPGWLGRAVVWLPTVVLSAATLAMLVALVALVVRRRRRRRDDLWVVQRPRGQWSGLVVVLLLLPVVAVVVLATRVVARVAVPAPAGAQSVGPGVSMGAPPTAPPSTGSPSPVGGWILIGVMVVLAVVAGLVVLRWTGRGRAGTVAGPARVDAGELAVAVQAAVSALETTRDEDPRAAVIACYAAMEASLRSTRAAPQASDAPTDVLARAVSQGLVRGPAAMRLTQLFTEARYSRHVYTVEHRDQAAEALRVIRAEVARAGVVA
ncbi:MAG TPA: DUF4129 domain-containing protein [Micromonosporaceae bacterium]